MKNFDLQVLKNKVYLYVVLILALNTKQKICGENFKKDKQKLQRLRKNVC